MILPIALRLIGMFLDKKQDDKESKEAFVAFLKVMEKNRGVSVNLYKEDMTQKEQLKKAHAELHKPKAD